MTISSCLTRKVTNQANLSLPFPSSLYVCYKAGKHLEMTGQSRTLNLVTSAKISWLGDLLSVKVPNERQRISPPLQKCTIFMIYGLYIVKG